MFERKFIIAAAATAAVAVFVLVVVLVAALAGDDTKSGNLLGGGDATRMKEAEVFKALDCKYVIGGTNTTEQVDGTSTSCESNLQATVSAFRDKAAAEKNFMGTLSVEGDRDCTYTWIRTDHAVVGIRQSMGAPLSMDDVHKYTSKVKGTGVLHTGECTATPTPAPS